MVSDNFYTQSMNERQLKILKSIIEEFVSTGNPVGSKKLLESENFHFSGATLRNEMASLEDMGLLTHPHTSAGRTPTDAGYRYYVEKIADRKEAEKRALAVYEEQMSVMQHRETRSSLHKAVGLLSDTTKNLAFATIPENESTVFLGIANVLRQPEFMDRPEIAGEVLEVVEHELHEILKDVPEKEGVQTFIGEENLIENFTSCAMLAVRYTLPGGSGVLGVLGPKRMDYAFNEAILNRVHNNLEKL